MIVAHGTPELALPLQRAGVETTNWDDPVLVRVSLSLAGALEVHRLVDDATVTPIQDGNALRVAQAFGYRGTVWDRPDVYEFLHAVYYGNRVVRDPTGYLRGLCPAGWPL